MLVAWWSEHPYSGHEIMGSIPEIMPSFHFVLYSLISCHTDIYWDDYHLIQGMYRSLRCMTKYV
jgi:hypothetical protein